MTGSAVERALGQGTAQVSAPNTSPSHPTTAPQPRKVKIRNLGPYQLIKPLGQGAMGTVFLAEDPMLARKVALKVLSKSKSEDDQFVARFKREATAAGKLNHAHIAGAYAVDEDKGYHYYAMEYCDGLPLNKVLKKSGCLAEEWALDLCIQIARGLQYAHQHGIIHRDIKPENAILTRDRVVKVLDLGLSKNITSSEGFQTMSGVAMGTPHYISPEQARGAKNIDGRTDIYSLGATLYHLTTGAVPFTGPTAAVIMTKHLSDPLPDPREYNPALTDGMVHILTRAMAKAPEDRYQNMEEFLKDMERVRDGQEPISERVDSARSNVAAQSGRMKRDFKTTGPNLPVAGRSGQRLRRVTGAQEAVRVTGRQRPIEGRSATSAYGSIDGRAPSGRQGEPVEEAPAARKKLAVVGAGAGVGLVVLLVIGFFLMGGDDKEGKATGNPKAAASVASDPSIPDIHAPATPVSKSGDVPPTTEPSEPRTEQAEYNPRAMVAKLRLQEIKKFASMNPNDPWSVSEMLKEFVASYEGIEAAEEARSLLKKLSFKGERPAARRNWHLEWKQVPDTTSDAIGSLATMMDGRPWVLCTYPPAEEKPLGFQRRLLVPADKPVLTFRVHGHKMGDFDLQLEVDGQPTARQTVTGKPWRSFSLDLKKRAGREVLISVQHIPTGWKNENAYWQAPEFTASAPLDASLLKWVDKPAVAPKPAVANKPGAVTAPAKPVTPSVERAPDTPAARSPFAGIEEDLAKAEVTGAKALKDQRAFKLRCKDDKAIAIGKGTKNRLLEIKKDALHIEQSLGGGKMVVPLSLSSLSAQTRYELAALGLPKGPEGSLRLAYAGLLAQQRGEDAISHQQMEGHLKAAAKDSSLRPLVKQIRDQLESPGEGAALNAWRRAENLFERKSMKEAKAAYDAFQKDFGKSNTAAENAELLKQRYAAIKVSLGRSNPLARKLSLDLGGGVRMDFVLVSAGDFMMGSSDKSRNSGWHISEGPVHKVTISKPFYVAKYPVTVAQFAKFVDATKHVTACEKKGNIGGTMKKGRWGKGTGINWRKPGFPQTGNHPVVLVDWNDAQAFAGWATKQLRKEVRLPTEAEWEYAARGPKNLVYPFGNTWDGLRVNHKDAALQKAGSTANNCSKDNDGYAFTSPVGKFKNASWCGAYDMSGNVWQWVQDYAAGYKSEPQVDPQGPANGQSRILRGGDWHETPSACRTAFRARFAPTFLGTHLGFRVVLVPASR